MELLATCFDHSTKWQVNSKVLDAVGNSNTPTMMDSEYNSNVGQVAYSTAINFSNAQAKVIEDAASAVAIAQ